MTLAGWIVSPFLDYGFMRRALAGACALSLGAAPLGVFLVLRRMSLMGDAMSHAILPGVAAGFLLSGLSLWAMMLGGILTGLAVALLSGIIGAAHAAARGRQLRRLLSDLAGPGRAAGVAARLNMDLLHVLFGTVLGLDDDALLLVTGTASVTLLAVAAIYRLLVAECLTRDSQAPAAARAAGCTWASWCWWW